MAVAKYKIVRKCPVCGERKHDEEKRQLELDKIVSNMPKSKEYISITEAYAMFGASRSTIYRLIYMKKISFIEPEKGIRLVCKGELMNLFPLRQSPLDTKPRKPEDCYTIGEISKKFHLDDSTVYAHIRKYSIPTRQIGNYVYAHKESIDKLYKDIKPL